MGHECITGAAAGMQIIKPLRTFKSVPILRE
jgi:hypothetical protein